MPTKKTVTTTKVLTPTSGHTPVSNLPKEVEQIEAIKATLSEAPEEGKNPGTIQPGKEGIETVKGFNFRPVKAESLSELYTAPDTSKLEDIGVASFGPPPPLAETVHGRDDRIKITNTSIYPWRAIASLLITAKDGSRYIGTGWFIGPHTVMTAGHCVFIRNSGVPARDGWVRYIDVMPGRNGSSLPYGSVRSSSFCSVTGWTIDGNENFDYGVIKLPNNLGNATGWFGFGVYSDADLKSCVGNIAGYPGDKPSGTMWYDAHQIANVNSRKVYYDIDTYGGQSGSAVFRIKNGGRYGIAIHCYGGTTTNSGTRIVRDVYNNMVAWKA